MLKATPQFLRDFRKPILINPMEYMRNLRVYGLQKTEEGTDYTMMQDWSRILVIIYPSLGTNGSLLDVNTYIEFEKVRENLINDEENDISNNQSE